MSTSATPVPDFWNSPDFTTTTPEKFGINKVIEHGQVLRGPATRMEGTTNDVAYVTASCFQLDQTHCLALVGTEEQGGGDLCVGNDGFVFERISDIKAENAIPINRVDRNFQPRNNPQKACLAKFPMLGGFIPLGAKLKDGRPHPAAGTGFGITPCCLFSLDKTSALANPESFIEFCQLRWDGKKLTVSPGVHRYELLGMELSGDCGVTQAVPQDEGLLFAMGVLGKVCVFRFDWDGEKWEATKHGEPFAVREGRKPLPGEAYKIWPAEIEPSLLKNSEGYLLHTRGADDPCGRLYESDDGFNFRKINDRPNHTVPQVLNRGLDGSFYVATNPGGGLLRNPLFAYPLQGDKWGLPITIHDQGGVRDDKGSSIPFIDHGMGYNLFLEGRWRHLNMYRVCDLKERTFHAYQIADGTAEKYTKGGPLPHLLPTSGVNLTEFEYEKVVNPPWKW